MRFLPRSGFTLLEMLVTVAIVGVLAALAAAGLGKARESAQVTAATNQIRQVGAAVLNYAADNGSQLPGPLFTSIAPRTRSTDTQQLPTVIAPYLGRQVTTQWQVFPELLPPTWKRFTPSYNPATDDLRTFECNENDFDPRAISSRPFGYPGSFAWSSTPLRLVSVERPDSLWLIRERAFVRNGQTNFPTAGKRLFLFASGRVSLEDPGFRSRTSN